MKEIHLLPEPLLKTPSVTQLNSWYVQSFQEILEFETADTDDAETLDRLDNFYCVCILALITGKYRKWSP